MLGNARLTSLITIFKQAERQQFSGCSIEVMGANGRIICAGCGISLDSALEFCTECGTTISQSSEERPLLAAIQRKITSQPQSSVPTTPHLVYLSPEDEGRRFPLFTQAQLTLIGAGLGLLILLLTLGYVVWRQQKREMMRASAPVPTQMIAAPTPEPSFMPSPSPSPPSDATILEAIKTAVVNFDPTGAGRYTIEVKDGIVTVTGEAETQPEKDGIENVIRPIPGVKATVNNLIVRLTPVMIPIRLNQAEANRLEEALRKQYEANNQSSPPSEEAETQRRQFEIERAAEAKRREDIATKIREEEERLRRESEERVQREAAEYERRLEEQRRLEAERRARAEQARLEANIVRSGTVAWSGQVDGIAEVIMSGGSASIRNLSGEPSREAKSSFSAPIPRSPITVKILSTSGRGTVLIAQEPSATNGYTTIIRIDDSAKGGYQRYEFTLRWSAQ